MKLKQLMIAGCSILVLSTGAALAGPCDTGRSAGLKDAGSGPAKMGDSQTTGMASNTGQHPPTEHDESNDRRRCSIFAGYAAADARRADGCTAVRRRQG